MKKIFLIIFFVIMLLSITSCFKSEEAQAVDDIIAALGTIEIDNEQPIIDAEKAVENLDKKTKKQLDNLDNLKKARMEYNNLLIERVQVLISEIGEVTTKSNDVISKARVAYDDLPEELKSSVNNYSTLTEAENTIIEKKAQAIDEKIESIKPVTLKSQSAINAAKRTYEEATDAVKSKVTKYNELQNNEKEFNNLKAQNVIKLIDSIGSVKLESKNAIDKADDEYSALSSEQKKLVTNLSTLTDAKRALKEITTKTLNTALAKMRKSTDEVEGIAWYHSKTEPYYANTRSYVLPYIGCQGNSPYLIIKFNYTGDNWIFFDNVTILVDGQRYYETFKYGEIQRDNGGGDVCEVAHISDPNSSDISLLRKIAASKKTIVRFEGDARHYDLTVSAADKKAITEVLDVFEMWENK